MKRVHLPDEFEYSSDVLLNLRSRLAAGNVQVSNAQCDVPMLSSSEGSLYSGCCNSGSGSDVEADPECDPVAIQQPQQCNTCFSPGSHVGPAAASPSYKAATRAAHLQPVKQPHPASVHAVTPKSSNHSRNVAPSSERDVSFENDSVYSTLQAAVRKMTSVVVGEQQDKDSMSPSSANNQTDGKAETSVTSSNRKKTQRQELRKRLQEVKLTSESGNASVIEVIEPSSSDEDDQTAPTGRPQDQSTPIRNFPNARSFNASFSEELEKARQNKIARPSATEAESKSAGVSAASNAESSYSLAEPDLLAGTVNRGDGLVVPSARPDECGNVANAENEADAEADYDQVIVGSSTRSSSSLSNVMSSVVSRKKAGFLTKFSLKARWPSKRKPSGSEAVLSTESQSSDSPDLSIEDSALRDLCDRDETMDADNNNKVGANNSAAAGSSQAGVVAGLSQMFEDMSKAKMSPSVSAVSVGPILEKRVPSRNSTASAALEDSTDSVTRNGKSPADFHAHDSDAVMSLPSATSPPPVPIEIETYNSSPTSSQQETGSSHGNAHRLPHPPPPPRFSSHLSSAKSSGDLSKVGVGPTASMAPPSASSSSSSTSASTSVHGGVESLSVAASEDSGIVVARPASSASKSDSSRPTTTSVSYAAFTVFKTSSSVAGYPLRKASSVSGELPTPDSSLGSGERLSPAPSDLSKTESALSPPSHASDLSKTESMRHFRQLARIEETTHLSGAARSGQSMEGSPESAAAGRESEKEREPATTCLSKADATKVANHSVVDMAAQSGQILTWREAKLKNQVVTPPPLEERHLKVLDHCPLKL